jgi:hypothetical protein
MELGYTNNNPRIKHYFYPFIFLLSYDNMAIYVVSQLNHQVIHLALKILEEIYLPKSLT